MTAVVQGSAGLGVTQMAFASVYVRSPTVMLRGCYCLWRSFEGLDGKITHFALLKTVELYSRNQLGTIYYADLGYAADEIMSLETAKAQKDKMSQLCSNLFTPLKIDTFLSTGRKKRLIFNQPRTDFLNSRGRPQGLCWPGRKPPGLCKLRSRVPRQFQTIPSSSGEERGWRECNKEFSLLSTTPHARHSRLLLALRATAVWPLGIWKQEIILRIKLWNQGRMDQSSGLKVTREGQGLSLTKVIPEQRGWSAVAAEQRGLRGLSNMGRSSHSPENPPALPCPAPSGPPSRWLPRMVPSRTHVSCWHDPQCCRHWPAPAAACLAASPSGPFAGLKDVPSGLFSCEGNRGLKAQCGWNGSLSAQNKREGR